MRVTRSAPWGWASRLYNIVSCPEQRAREAEAKLDLEIQQKQRINRRAKRAAWRQLHVWHPHLLRHNAATRLRKEFGLETAQVILGHKTLAVTEVYVIVPADFA